MTRSPHQPSMPRGWAAERVSCDILEHELGDIMKAGDPRRRILDDMAGRTMRDMLAETWQVRHMWLERLAVRNPLIVSRIYRIGSPDMFLYGENTGKQPEPIIALPDKPRGSKRQATPNVPHHD